MSRIESHILIVDDDDRIRELTGRYLSSLGYHVTLADGAEAALNLFRTLAFDLIVLDVMMPGMDGFALLQKRRDLGDTTPVIMLTARGEGSDRIEGLKRGADDYVTKPFDPEELGLRIAAILKRIAPEETIEEIEMSGMIFNLARGELKDGNNHVRLTDSEIQLLRTLAERAGEPVSREALAQVTRAGVERSIDVQITRLRRKIEPDPKEPIHIQTVRGIGYRLLPDR